MDTLDLAVLGLAALVTSALTAVAGLGGGIILIAILLLYLEPVAAIPIHGAIQLVSNVSRTAIQRRHVDLAIVALFCVLLVPGSWLGLQILSTIPPGTTCFLVISFQALGYIIMDHKTDIRLVNSHSECDGGHYDIHLFHQELVLV